MAGRLNNILLDAISQLRNAGAIAETERTATAALLKAGFDSVDYVAIRDADTLQSIARVERPARILAAAKIGRTRLIDNMAVPQP